MKYSIIFREAAKYLHKRHSDGLGIGCCSTILFYDQLKNRKYEDHEESLVYFSALFGPSKRVDRHSFWWKHPMGPNPDTEARVFALLLAAEIAKSEGK